MPRKSIAAESILDNTWIRSIIQLESTDSTSDAARQILESGDCDHPLVVITANQRCGRGQRGAVWWSDDGSLTFTIVFDGHDIRTPALISFAAAIAVCRAIVRESCLAVPRVKWPNDIYLTGKKVAGILIESCLHANRRFYFIGIGVNANSDLTNAPKTIQRSAISVNDLLGRSVEIEPMLIELLNQLQQNLIRADRAPDELIDDYSSHSIFDNSTLLSVRVADGSSKTGRFCGFSQHGKLRIRDGSEILELSSGHVESRLNAD